MLRAMRVLHRYILAECVPTMGLSLLVFIFVLLMHRLYMLADLVIAKGVPPLEVLFLLSLALPALLPVLLPVSLLLAVLLTMGRLSADSEITAMRAAGLGLAANLKPVMAVSVVVGLLAAATSLWAQPAAARAFQEALYRSVKNRISVTAESGNFTNLTRGVTVYAERVDDREGRLENLFLHLDRGTTRDVWIFAHTGELRDEEGSLGLILQDGEMHQGGGPKPYYRLRFGRYDLRLPLPAANWTPEVQEMATPALAGLAYGEKHDAEARMELHQRLALPAACVVFGLLGTVLGLHHSRAGRSRGVTLCLGVLLVFYALLTSGQALGKGGVLPPEVALWLPDLLFGAFALYAYFRKNREAPLPLEDAIGRGLGRVRRWLVRERAN
jgi:lipopolysaccharide export system permease protein